MAYLVYPGALHTRFDHTLGVLHVASKLCQALGIDEDHTREVRLAALLHDIGHGPFSHVSETILKDLATRNLVEIVGRKEKIHELITQKIILESKDLILNEKMRQRIAKLLKEGLDHRIYRDIISGPLDADKQDYLLRDSYFCGVQYGLYDIHQLHNTLRVWEDSEDQSLMVDRNGLHVLEQFVLAKYYLTTQVYRHKVRLIADNMLIRGIRLGVQIDKIPFLEKLYIYQDTPEYIDYYLKWDDRKVVTELLKDDHEKQHAGILFRRLANRQLFKRIFTIELRELPAPIADSFLENFPQKRADMEAQIAQKLQELINDRDFKVDANHVILHDFNIDSVRTQSRNAEGSIMILDRPKPIPFEDKSILFKSIDESLKEDYLECYAPVKDLDEKEKRDLNSKMHEFILELLGKTFSERRQDVESGKEA